MGRCYTLLFAMTIAVVAAAAEKSGNRGTDAKTTPDINLNGIWRGFVVYGRGEQPNRGSVHLELTIKGNQITAQRLDGQGGSLGQGTYTISTERFYLLDATESRTRGKRGTYLGICKFGPDLMQWCVATPGNQRPTDFQTKGQQFLLILKRQRQ
jgi:hypothetical protein